MKYNDLNVIANKKPSRKGRGIAAGQGKTAGRGTKGQKSRTERKPELYENYNGKYIVFIVKPTYRLVN